MAREFAAPIELLNFRMRGDGVCDFADSLAFRKAGLAWPTGKLHAVVIGTIFTLAFLMALVSQFGLVKPAARRASASPTIVRTAVRQF